MADAVAAQRIWPLTQARPNLTEILSNFRIGMAIRKGCVDPCCRQEAAMAYLETSRAATAPVTPHPFVARLLQAHAASFGWPALEQSLRAHGREVRRMLAAALLATALIAAVAAALLVRS
jgi:hypothetical protein